tara:strand:- start:1220 stop:2464 length:1245 start_codon:yes stop_codon:yes gene_type:complete
VKEMTAFDEAWGAISKDFYLDNSHKGMRTAGEWIGPKAYGKTQINDAKGRRTGVKGLLNKPIDINAQDTPEDGNPSSQNTVLTGDAFDGEEWSAEYDRRFDTKPYDSSERKERGEGATPNDSQSPSNFRRGGSLPRTNQITTDSPQLNTLYQDKEGQTMDPKYLGGNAKTGGGWDRTGKRYFANKPNAPRKFEGQEREYTTHIGSNLSPYGGQMKEGEMNEDEAIEGITSTLGHEYTHQAIDEDMKEAVHRGDLPSDHYNAAHEVGAHIGQHSDLDDEEMEEQVNDDLFSHPATNFNNFHRKTPEKFRRATAHQSGGGHQLKMPRMARSTEDIKRASFDQAWSSITKGRFQGYTQSNIGDRPVKAGKAKAWGRAAKVKRGRTQKRYARNKSRGNVRPAMRRQLGAGGKRAKTTR